MRFWEYELQVAYPIADKCPECGGQLKRWRCRCFCMDCHAIIHAIWPLKASGVKYIPRGEGVQE